MNKNALRKTLLELIAINEVYPDEKEVLRYAEGRLDKAGIAWQEDKFHNIIAKIPGTGDPLLLSTHVDIPEPVPNLKYLEEGDIIKANGSGILGVDPKAGLAVLLEFAEEVAKQDRTTHVPLEFVLTRGEEAGLRGAINLDYSLLRSKMGLVFDEDGPVTQVVSRAPTYVRIDATFHGKAVHPREPEKGINALVAACEAVLAIPPGYSTKGVTWNVGLFEAGTARNTVPGKAVLAGELRSYDTDLVASEGKRVEKTWKETAKKYGAICELDPLVEFEGFSMDKDSPLLKKIEETLDSMNLKGNYYATFGGSDANVFNAHGITSVAVGSGYYNAHQYTEYVNLQDMLDIGRFLKRFIGVREDI